jgi:hypothetical protein
MVASMAANDPTQMPLAADVRYTENAFEMTLTESLWSSVGPADQARHLIDVDQCSTFTEIIVTDAGHPYVIGVRMTLGASNEISELEAIVTDEGDWAFDASGYLDCTSQEDWGPLSAAEQVSRQDLIDGGNAYLDIFDDKSVTVPWDESSCKRTEGGSGCMSGADASGNFCDMGIPDDLPITGRRHYVDVEIGSVVIICLFGGGMLDTHMFRLESGLIHYVHTLSIQGDQGPGTGW